MKPRVVIVLSATRSGSSALTSMLARLGLDIGPRGELKRGGKHNKYGYFEKLESLRINKEILAQSYRKPARKLLESTGLGGHEIHKVLRYWCWFGYHEPVSSSAQLTEQLRRRMKKAADGIKPGEPVPVWKDARFYMTLPAWSHLIDPICIVLWRAPKQTAASIEDITFIRPKIGLTCGSVTRDP